MFVGIEDDNSDSDWVAGVTLSAQAKMRIVAADDSELPECSQADIEAAKPVAQSQKDEALAAAAKGGKAPEVERLLNYLVKIAMLSRLVCRPRLVYLTN